MDHDLYAHGDTTLGQVGSGADQLFELGIRYSACCSGRSDLVVAHMCFNLAAAKGHREATERRLEIAAEMSAAEIAAAQSAARNWLATH